MKLPSLSNAAAATARLAAALAILSAAWLPAAAQGSQSSGFQVSGDEPVRIEADVLEVFDEQGKAVFTGNVMAQQGEMTLHTVKLTVFYAGGAMGREMDTEGGESGGAPQAQSIKRLDAEGDVVVTTKDQKATGDRAVFRMEENAVTLTGDVVLTQGGNVLRGTELVVDLDTGRSKLVSNDKSGQPSRVTGMFVPGSGKDGESDPAEGSDAAAGQ